MGFLEEHGGWPLATVAGNLLYKGCRWAKNEVVNACFFRYFCENHWKRITYVQDSTGAGKNWFRLNIPRSPESVTQKELVALLTERGVDFRCRSQQL